jgi:hypothetical protein
MFVYYHMQSVVHCYFSELQVCVVLKSFDKYPCLLCISQAYLYSFGDTSIMINEYGAVGRMKFGKKKRSARREPALVPFCPPPNPT